MCSECRIVELGTFNLIPTRHQPHVAIAGHLNPKKQPTTAGSRGTRVTPTRQAMAGRLSSSFRLVDFFKLGLTAAVSARRAAQ